MTSDPDQIREQIEETRTSLSEDVNTLADTVNPAHAARRTAASARSAVLGVKDKVTGHHQDPVWCRPVTAEPGSRRVEPDLAVHLVPVVPLQATRMIRPGPAGKPARHSTPAHP
jgi:hypothetical protein